MRPASVVREKFGLRTEPASGGDGGVTREWMSLLIAATIIAIFAGGCEPKNRALVPYRVTFESGRVDTLYADEWTGLMYDAQHRRVRFGRFETSTRLGGER